MEMEKKNLAIILLAIVLAASGVGNIILGIQLGFIEVEPPRKGGNLVFGTFQGDIVYLDPVYAYDSASIDVIDQVVERLYWFDIADPTYPAVPALATDYPTVTPDGLTWTIPIRENVMFHDNKPLNASAVKWNFDRLMWFCNYSGNQYLPAPFNVPLPTSLPSGIPTPTQTAVVYFNPDGTPIINETIADDAASTITFKLNAPKAAWLSILAFSASGIMSPHSTPANDYIELSGDLIGTGPFIYDAFIAGVMIRISGNPEYWRPRPELDTVTIVVLSSLSVLNQALLSGDIDILLAMDPAFIDQHDDDPDIHLEYAGGTLSTGWVTFNMDLIPLAMRKSIAYCLNYSYIIKVVYERVAVRLPTYIPMGIAYANYTLDYPTFDRTAARAILLADSVYGPILTTAGISAASPDSAWTTLADTTPLEHYNYSWNMGNDLRHDTGDRLAADMRYIGCQLDVNSMAWADLIAMIVVDREHLGLYMLGWRPDYIDPENYITAIWGNTSAINGGNYGCGTEHLDVQKLMEDGMVETDPVVRKHIYDEIQRLMVERDYPGLTLTTGLNYDAWKNEVKGYISNPLGNVWWYSVSIE